MAAPSLPPLAPWDIARYAVPQDELYLGGTAAYDAGCSCIDLRTGWHGGYVLLQDERNLFGFDVSFEVQLNTNANGLGLVYFDLSDHASLSLSDYARAWLGAGDCKFGRQHGGACRDVVPVDRQYVSWGMSAPGNTEHGLTGYSFNECDEAVTYKAAPIDGRFPDDSQQVRQYAWPGGSTACSTAWRGQWVGVRVWLAPETVGPLPEGTERTYTLGVETDHQALRTLQITGLDDSNPAWRLAIGSSQYQTPAGRVLVRNITVAGNRYLPMPPPSQPPSQPPSESPSEASSPLEHSRLARRWLKGIQTKTPGETPSMIDLTLLVNKIQQQPDEFSPTSVVAGLDYPASSSCLCACPVRPCPPE